ncbi:beta-ketoacyl synthase chain length factor [Mucilaginibacter sp. AW1-3]
MKTYIRSAASISPQNTFNNAQFLDQLATYNGNRLNSIEPDYNEIIPQKLIRRMSRIIKMSVASALTSLNNAGITVPDAIVTGTAYGCLEDTGIFLSQIVEHNEEPITPTAFVQSTHNTIGAQIALIIKCNHYNNTFVSGGVSFESALLDAMMLLSENEMANVLVGGMDEITDVSHIILNRTGLYKRNPVSNISLFNLNTKGTIGGEGAAFFVLATTPDENNLACLDAVGTFYKPTDINQTVQHILSFLAQHATDLNDIDLVITGDNGDKKNDEIYAQLRSSVFKSAPVVKYKNLCGEYPTSTAFATWLAANIIKTNSIPAVLSLNGKVKNNLNKVLIYNNYQNIYHSLILMSAC